jgi:hypothetical protein
MSFLDEFVRKSAFGPKNIHVRLASDDTPMDEIAREAAFKRGFHHGIITVLEAAAQYLRPEVLTNLRRYEAEVREWRYTRQQSGPPEPDEIA